MPIIVVLGKKMREKIINIFYEEIIPKICKKGIIELDHTYLIRFDVNINGKLIANEEDDYVPCLMIQDINRFNDALVDYIIKHMVFFHKKEYHKFKDTIYLDNSDNQIRYLLIFAFVNATVTDFNNPISYLEKRTSFIENESLMGAYPNYTKVGTISELDHSDILIRGEYQLPALETVHSFQSQIKNESGTYQLPNISYGICEQNGKNKAVIYAIQGKPKTILTQYEKRINRLLYKINKGLEVDVDNSENEKNVSANSVLALTIFLKVLKEHGIAEIEAVDYLPVRYREKTDKQIAVINLFKNVYSNDILEKKYKNQKEEQEFIQQNITNKFIRTFNRVNYHLENMDIIYPGEIDSYFHATLKDEKIADDNLLNIVYNTVLGETKRK